MKLKEFLRERVAFFASLIEILISVIVLIAILITGAQVVGELFGLIGSRDQYAGFSTLIGHAFNLVIGIEFIKMLSKHTPGSAIEVLLFAIARQMVVEHTTPLENLLSIIAIALIFVIRKFLFVPSFGAHMPSTTESAHTSHEEKEIDEIFEEDTIHA
ncbi:MAG: transporter [Ruthenibacterium sp.]